MSSELKSIFNSMLVGKVPAMWAAKSYTSFNHMGSYVTDLLARLQLLQVRFMIGVSHLDHDHLWNMTAKISVAHTKELKVSSMCSLLGLQLLFRYSEKMHAEKVQAKTLRICIITNDLLSCILAVTIFLLSVITELDR